MELRGNYNKDLNTEFAASMKNVNKIKLLTNKKLTEVANYTKLDTPEKKEENELIAHVKLRKRLL